MRWLCSCAACVALAVPALCAADPQLSPAVRAAAADSAYRARDWAGALPLYRQLVGEHPDNYLLWLRLAACLDGDGQHGPALAAFADARRHGAPAAAVQYGMARALAAQGERAPALAALREAIAAGRGRPDLLRSDPALDALRGEPGFAALLQQAQQNQSPCEARPANRQFDFWVGDWQVVSSTDFTPVGRSHVERTLGDCVIWENWTSLGESGYAGKSYNSYNPELQRWEQFWVDNQGGMIHFYGVLNDAVMDFYTDLIPQGDGKTLKRHLRFYRLGPDRVRQLSEGSADQGGTWTVEYDFTYNRER